MTCESNYLVELGIMVLRKAIWLHFLSYGV